MPDEREMTLDEWCDRLPNHHLVNRQLAELKELESRQQQWIPIDALIPKLHEMLKDEVVVAGCVSFDTIREAIRQIKESPEENSDEKQR